MPAWMLPAITIPPKIMIRTVRPASTERCEGPDWLVSCVLMGTPSAWKPPAGSKVRRLQRARSVTGEEAGFLHQLLVTILFVRDPFRVVGAGHEGGVEGAVLHEVLPLGRLAHLL